MKSMIGRVRQVASRLSCSKPGEPKELGQGIVDRRGRRFRVTAGLAGLGVGTVVAVNVFYAFAAPLPGGTLDPLSIPKYVTDLVIPPVMNQAHMGKGKDKGDLTDDYQIAIRQFKQQILPAGFPSTKVWSYGPESDPTPSIAPNPGSQFNYPAYTIETIADRRVNVRWINGLVDKTGEYLPHLLPVDQTLHWANPSQDCMHGDARTDCMGKDPAAYRGPVPMVTHVHGSHVDPDSDGNPEAWWLPAAKNIPAGYARSGQLFDDATGSNNGNRGYADFSYRNDQPATTLWYHDHTLGMTRANVYAGPAGFWLVRGGVYDGGQDVTMNHGKAVLPGPAPVAGQGLLDLNTPGNKIRNSIREIPLVIQDRSFNSDGSLFYPGNRAFFEGMLPEQLKVLFAPNSDVAPIWNPEAFFNVMVVNGVSWPKLEVAKSDYRFRLLNGSNSRFINLALFVVKPNGEIDPTQEIPFYQIGADQGFLPQVVRTKIGEQVALTPGAGEPVSSPSPDNQRALLMAPAERADVIVDFSQLPDGTVVRMINTAPDSPFGGFPVDPADPDTTGQVIQFVVKHALTGAEGSTDGKTTVLANLQLNAEQAYGAPVVTRLVSLNEESSSNVCVPVDSEENFVLDGEGNLVQTSCGEGAGAFGPSAAKLGTVTGSGESAEGNPLQWTDETGASQPTKVTLKSKATLTVNVTEAPKLGDIEEWQIYNFTADAHPIHLHPVRFEVVRRTAFDGSPSQHGDLPVGEAGFKDTGISYPGEITTIRIKFDLPGLYAWHCHIVEHEDNEMMRPFVVLANPPSPHHHDNGDRDRHHHKKMKHHYRWADRQQGK